MNFVRSRLMLVGFVLSVPALQAVACTAEDRTFAVDGDGGEPDPGEGGNVGNGGTPTGGVPSGGGTNGGEAGGGIIIQGGQGGEPVIDPDCEPTGKEVCADGVDNDCDGETDCLVLRGQFPPVNGASSGSDVQYSFSVPHESATFQCRAAHGTVITATTAWGDCGAVDGGRVSPFDAATSADAEQNGLWMTDVRLSFPDGGTSARYRRPVYIHNSMHGATRCPQAVTDEAFFAAAKPDLQDAGAFEASTIRSPFISLDFDPPVNEMAYGVTAADGQIDLRSLRRRFSLSADGLYLLITRNYTSLKAGGMGCTAFEKRVHSKRGSWITAGNMTYQRCAGLVLNKKGAGICLGVSGTTVVSAEYVRVDGGAQVPAPTYSPNADNFAWRKLRAGHGPGPGLLANFSPKCDDEGCGTAATLFLPDAALFEYWGG